MSHKLSKSDTLDKDTEQAEKDWFANLPVSQHFEPGTWVVYKNERFLVLCYRESDGRMVIDNERTTLSLNTYSMQWRKHD